MKRTSKDRSNGNGMVNYPVRFEFKHPTAKVVAVAGTFNDWRPGAGEMVALGDGRWSKELVLAPGQYEYRLVVDGEWMTDPHGRESTPNPFGGLNSVLKVGKAPE